MNFSDRAQALTPNIVQRFKRAIELGKWPDGRTVTPEQREVCMQAVIAYELRHLPPEQRTGYIPPRQSACEPDQTEVEEKPLSWR